jgi:hypothetical protein
MTCGGKVALLALCLALLPISVAAQEWSISLGGGGSALKYQITQGAVKAGFGGSLGLGYTAFFSQSIGLSFGVEGSLYGSSWTASGLSDEYQIPTPPGLSGSFVLQTQFSGIEEKQRAVFLQVPLMLQFQKSVFYFAAGAKAGFAISKTWSQTVETRTTTGYSDFTNQVYQNMPNHGFETKYDNAASGSLQLGTPVNLALEAGFKWKTSNKSAIYTGFYLDYGLTNISKPDAKRLFDYSSSDPYNSVANSILQTEMLNSTQGLKPFAVGLKIKFAFGGGKDNNTAKPVPPPILAML